MGCYKNVLFAETGGNDVCSFSHISIIELFASFCQAEKPHPIELLVLFLQTHFVQTTSQCVFS